MMLYRHSGFGRLADFFVLDTRQCRGDQPDVDKKSPINDDAKNTARTILGRSQPGSTRS